MHEDPSGLPDNRPPPLVAARVAAWRKARNTVALGNLAEHVAMRLLPRLGYDVLATQRDLDGGITNIVGFATRSHPEDFIVITPEGRLATVNSKATCDRSPTGRRADGNLRAPRIPRNQRDVAYSSTRAAWLSPLDGDAFALVLKVDLTHQLAQMFAIDDAGTLTPVHDPVPVAGDLNDVCLAYPNSMPAPIGPHNAEADD